LVRIGRLHRGGFHALGLRGAAFALRPFGTFATPATAATATAATAVFTVLALRRGMLVLPFQRCSDGLLEARRIGGPDDGGTRSAVSARFTWRTRLTRLARLALLTRLALLAGLAR